MLFFKQRTKDDVVKKDGFSFGNKKSDGTDRKSGTTVTFKDGEAVTLLTPSGRGEKFAVELKSGSQMYNDGSPRVNADGSPVMLTNEQRAFRSGYLAAQKDNAKAYKARVNAAGAAANNTGKKSGGKGAKKNSGVQGNMLGG